HTRCLSDWSSDVCSSDLDAQMSAAPYQLGFIGAGKLAGSVIRGLLLKNFCTPDAILASEPNVETRAQLENELGLRLTTQNSEIRSEERRVGKEGRIRR